MVAKLKNQSQALDELWGQGLSGTSLLQDHSGLADQFIEDCFASIQNSGSAKHVAILALGGYGRQELFPFSDIDLMILYNSKLGKKVGELTDAILYPLWDTGYEVGHGVRTIKESMRQAAKDFVFRVAMLDARFIVGSKDLFNELMGKYKQKYVEGRRRDFVRNLNQFNEERRERFGSHGYLLEPNIKESKGGLRDIQSMIWAAQVVFGIDSFEGIVQTGFLLEQEAERFVDAQNMLVRVRNRLHYISGRKNDQLYFEQQEEMAAAFGHKNSTTKLQVEQFMREVYSHLRTIAVTTDLFFDHVNEVLSLADKKRGPADREIEDWIELRKNRIHLTARSEELQAKPHLLMRTFLASARTGVPIHHRSKMSITENLGLITFKLRSSPRMANPFMAILMMPQHVLPVLEGMLETGLLGVYLPEFARIDALAQHDIYHIYTVDRHSLQAVAELHKVLGEEAEIAEQVSMSKPLYLAALLHDIGKNSGRDHSEYGAELADVIGERLCLSPEERKTLMFLILYHLFIPENALRRDLEDTVFIKKCAEIIGSSERLAMLYLLSVADSRATGPSAWSDWKATLMRDMYLKLNAYLAHVDDEAPTMVDRQQEEGVSWLRGQVEKLAAKEDGLRMKVDELSADYLSSFTPGTILEHLRIHRDRYQLIRQKSLIVPDELGDHWSVLVMSVDQPGFLAKICGVMTLHNLTVVNAQIFTWADDTVVDVIDVRPAEGLAFDEYDWDAISKDLERAVSHRLGLGHRLYEKLKNSNGRKRELAGSHEHRVLIDNESSEDFSVIEVHASDISGQLYRIAQTLADFGINIHKAFIATEVGQLIDVFYVLDNRGRRVESSDFKEEVANGLMYAIGATDEQARK
ncbi:MAG: [protein-PII] uridylyltransferase [Desulfobacterales bacterium]|nr:[protein-PII] uridylyltransferase [Desulfobacterales bacterium]